MGQMCPPYSFVRLRTDRMPEGEDPTGFKPLSHGLPESYPIFVQKHTGRAEQLCAEASLFLHTFERKRLSSRPYSHINPKVEPRASSSGPAPSTGMYTLCRTDGEYARYTQGGIGRMYTQGGIYPGWYPPYIPGWYPPYIPGRVSSLHTRWYPLPSSGVYATIRPRVYMPTIRPRVCTIPSTVLGCVPCPVPSSGVQH